MIESIRSQLCLTLGLLGAVIVLLVGAVTSADSGHGHLLGIADSFWALAMACLVVGLFGQMLMNSRAALHRERNLVRTAAQLREVSAELDRLARTDALTGIANRRAFFDTLGIEFRRSKRYGRQLSVLMLDLDHFKGVNDRWGHPFGDEVLRQTTEVISANIRESDLIGRYGGEEFALGLPETPLSAALEVAEKLRAAIEAHEFRTSGVPRDGEPPVRLTISIGVAALPVEEEQDEVELLGRADQALYDAKRTGRNRVVAYRKVDESASATSEGAAIEADAS